MTKRGGGMMERSKAVEPAIREAMSREMERAEKPLRACCSRKGVPLHVSVQKTARTGDRV